jgi:hypothetical protein
MDGWEVDDSDMFSEAGLQSEGWPVPPIGGFVWGHYIQSIAGKGQPRGHAHDGTGSYRSCRTVSSSRAFEPGQSIKSDHAN